MPTKNTLFEKLFDLEKRLKEVEGMKKSMAKDYRDQIKDIKDEISETMLELEDCGMPASTTIPVDFTVDATEGEIEDVAAE